MTGTVSAGRSVFQKMNGPVLQKYFLWGYNQIQFFMTVGCMIHYCAMYSGTPYLETYGKLLTLRRPIGRIIF